jgi:DNA polymerase (family 10)
MENVEIATALSEVADLLDIQGDSPFKVRAYRNAVRTIGNLTRPLSEMVAEGADLEELPGIGKDMAGYIVELLTTSHLRRLEALERQIPPGLVDLMRLEGLGPKKARRLHDELDVDSLDDLERALEAGEVEALKGFGAKTAANLRRSLEELRSRPQRTRLADADQLIRPLLGWMQAAPGIERVEAAGSYRRRAETVGDVDLLAICARPGPVMARFTDYPDVLRVEATGRTRGTVVLKAGLKVDLRILPRRSYGAALHYFTGSKAHNIAVRKLGVAEGLRISEYGVFRAAKGGAEGRRAGGAGGRRTRAGEGRRIGGDEEEDVFRAVGMAWVPPELRENRGEIEGALAGRLPKLVRLEDIRGDTSSATATGPTATTRSRRWRWRLWSGATSTWRSRTTAARSRWPEGSLPRSSSGSGRRSPRSAGSSTGSSSCSAGWRWTSCATAGSTCRTRTCASSTWWWWPCTRTSGSPAPSRRGA